MNQRTIDRLEHSEDCRLCDAKEALLLEAKQHLARVFLSVVEQLERRERNGEIGHQSQIGEYGRKLESLGFNRYEVSLMKRLADHNERAASIIFDDDGEFCEEHICSILFEHCYKSGDENVEHRQYAFEQLASVCQSEVEKVAK